jgi:hypothetical protein
MITGFNHMSFHSARPRARGWFLERDELLRSHLDLELQVFEESDPS